MNRTSLKLQKRRQGKEIAKGDDVVYWQVATFGQLSVTGYARVGFERLLSLSEQFPPDEHAANFAGARANLIELGISKQTASG